MLKSQGSVNIDYKSVIFTKQYFNISTFYSMFIIVNPGYRHSFCPNNSKVYCQKRTALISHSIDLYQLFVKTLKLFGDTVHHEQHRILLCRICIRPRISYGHYSSL